jgi:hypothetical protein
VRARVCVKTQRTRISLYIVLKKVYIYFYFSFA